MKKIIITLLIIVLNLFNTRTRLHLASEYIGKPPADFITLNKSGIFANAIYSKVRNISP